MKFLVILMLLASVSYAGITDVGNGGTGVLLHQTPYLLDLYEAGMTAPAFDRNLKPLPQFTERARKMSFLTSEEMLLLSLKLTELEKISPLVANNLALGLEMFLWRLTDQSLVDVRKKISVRALDRNICDTKLRSSCEAVPGRLQERY